MLTINNKHAAVTVCARELCLVSAPGESAGSEHGDAAGRLSAVSWQKRGRHS